MAKRDLSLLTDQQRESLLAAEVTVGHRLPTSIDQGVSPVHGKSKKARRKAKAARHARRRSR